MNSIVTIGVSKTQKNDYEIPLNITVSKLIDCLSKEFGYSTDEYSKIKLVNKQKMLLSNYKLKDHDVSDGDFLLII